MCEIKDKIKDALKSWVSNAASLTGFNWVAVDRDGSVWIYKEKPRERIADWISSAASTRIGCTTSWTLIKNWQHTLTEIKAILDKEDEENKRNSINERK